MKDMTDKIDDMLRQYQKEQQDFENHWLWKKLKTTPKEFFAKIAESVEKSGISKSEWQEKLMKMKKVFETRSREKRGQYQAVDFKNVRGIKV
jgi:hypothetical protein